MQVTGIVRIKVDGALLNSKEGAKLSGILGVEREEVMSAFGVAGYAEKPVVPTIECTLIHGKGTKLKALDFTSATVTFETDVGAVYVLGEAWLANALELSANGGEVACTIKARTCEEMS